MKRIRVLVANRPRMMRELVMATLADQPDIEVIGEVQDDAEIAQVAADSHPDFVIVTLDKPDERPLICDVLLRSDPTLKMLALAPQRNRSILFWAVFSVHSAIIENSEDGLLNALRGSGLRDLHEVTAGDKPN